MVKTKKRALNFKILRFFLIPTILVSTPFLNNIHNAKAGLEFQWDQNSGIRRLKWLQKQNQKSQRAFKKPETVKNKRNICQSSENPHNTKTLKEWSKFFFLLQPPTKLT